MASNQRALAEPAEAVSGVGHLPGVPGGPGLSGEDAARHRLPKLRAVSRGSTVLGMAAMAAVGAGGVAAAASKTPIPVSVPDLPPTHALATAADLAPAPAAARPVAADAGQLLVTRILAQAQSPYSVADQADDRDQADQADQVEAVEQQAVQDAEREAAEEAAAKEAAARKVREQAAQKKAAEAARQQAAARAAAEARALSYLKPVPSATLTAGFGEASSPWATVHTGQDFAAPTGTPVLAVHGGTITSAGWAGSYGYRIVLTLEDGTQLWYCHLSSMVKTSGTVTTGDVIGRVGATGNVTSPHLHLEVRPGGGKPVDPLGWLREHGAAV